MNYLLDFYTEKVHLLKKFSEVVATNTCKIQSKAGR